jgi:iron complex outermembrane receptor protein
MNYIKRLDEEGLNLIIIKNRKPIFKSSKKGMVPLLEAIENLGLPKLPNSIVVDKLVGKAAALIICFFKAREVQTKILSVKAREVLEKYEIKHSSERVIPKIMNKSGTNICPFEKAVSNTQDPAEGYKQVVTEAEKLGIWSF